MTLNELYYEVLEIIRKTTSDDESIDSRLIKSLIHEQAALWKRNELNKNRSIDDFIIQDLGCVALNWVDGADCCSVLSGCKLLRTVLPIPVTIERYNETSITRVAPIHKINLPFTFVGYNRAIWSGNGKFNKNVIYAFLLNKYMYLKSATTSVEFASMKYINIRGVFADPTEVAPFTTCSGTSCYNDNSEYPLATWMWNYIKPEVIKQLQIKTQSPTDIVNNSSDNTSLKVE